jgi:hypothetical protein
LLVLVALIPAERAFRYVNERAGVVIAMLVGHTAWHWLAERFAALKLFIGGLA